MNKKSIYCAKCGAPKTDSWEGESQEERFATFKHGEPTCNCCVGWNDTKPSRTLAENSTPGWYIRKQAGIIDTRADVDAHYIGRVIDALEKAQQALKEVFENNPRLPEHPFDMVAMTITGCQERLFSCIHHIKTDPNYAEPIWERDS